MTEPTPTGILMVNLGTPAAPTPEAVKIYLAEFLSDPYIIKIPKLIWWPILHGIILRTRPKKTAKLYQKIWSSKGSPLLYLSQSLAQQVSDKLLSDGKKIPIILGMRYGEPSIRSALTQLQQLRVQKIIVLPLYPQYSTTTTASTETEIKDQLHQLSWQPVIKLISDYHDDTRYITAIAHSITQFWQQHKRGQMLVYSFHGLPKKYVSQGDPYYQHCLTSARLISNQLGLHDSQWRVVFQSRFGAQEWLQPYCAETLALLPKEGINKVDIVCPGFPVDCLETLEEIAIANKEIFLAAGGSDYRYIPALNDTDEHVDLISGLLDL